MSDISITERSNFVTFETLDKVSSEGLLKLLRQADAQIFSGYSDYDGLNDKNVQDEIISLVNTIVKLLEGNVDSKINIAFGGAGTSGRLAFFIARAFNRLLKDEDTLKSYSSRIRFHYLIAGGDRSLTVGIEGAEDDIEQSIKDIEKFTPKSKDDYLLYIGITCGFSAPYVAGQLDFLMNLNSPSIISVLFGFNPVNLARKIKIEKWNHSFSEITERLNEKRQYQIKEKIDRNSYIINPIIGPEPLTGSTRMKSGTATKLLLEIIFAMILYKLTNGKLKLLNQIDQTNNYTDLEILRVLINSYEETIRETYYNIKEISEIIDSAANSLKNNGHIYYLSSDSMGIVGFIDASETVPTFGAKSTDVKGFLFNNEKKNEKGWAIMSNNNGDLSSISHEYLISEDIFNQTKLNNNDTLIITITDLDENPNQLLEKIKTIISTNQDKCPNIYLLSFNNNFTEFKYSKHFNIKLKFNSILSKVTSFYEISLKLILNSITTGGYIFYGKVFSNRMIDLSLTNNKLYFRSCGIVENIMKTSSEKSRIYLLRSIYSIEEEIVPKEIDESPVYKHIEYAEKNQVKNIVPVALLLASGKFNSPKLIREEFKKQPIIRYHLK